MKQKTNNKIFFIRLAIIIFSLYIITALYVQFFPLNYNNVNNTRWWLINKTFEKKYDLTDSNITTLIIGDSRPNAGLNFNEIKNCWSFCVGGATPIENYYFLKKYINSYGKPDTLFVSISPRFLTNQYAFWDLAVRNDFYNYNEIKQISELKNKFNDTVINNCIKLKFSLFKINYIKYYQADLRNNFVFLAKNKNLKLIKYIINHRGSRPHPNLKKSCSELNYEAGMKNFDISPLFDYYFYKIFEECKQKNIYCCFFSMPMNRSSYKKLNEKFIEEYKNYILQVQSDYPKFKISEKIYSLPDSLFGDASHLNKKGQKYFTQYFLKDF